jgi:hypothetical protein
MKKLLLIFGLFSVVNMVIFSQEVDRKFTVQTSPFLYVVDLISLGTGDDTDTLFIMDLEGQYKINENMNVSLTLSFLVNNRILYDYDTRIVNDTIHDDYYDFDYPINYVHYERYSYEENVFQINIKPMFVYRPFKTGLAGFYIGIYPNIGWQTLKSSRDENYLWTEIGIGINTGYKWVFSKGFTLQLGTGIGKTWSIPEKPDNSTDFIDSFINSDGRITLRKFDIHILDFKMGYSFR